MIVEAYGRARVLSNSSFRSARNYLSPCDYVTYVADPFGLAKGINQGNVEFVKTRGCFLFCHFIEEMTYKTKSIDLGELYSDKYGKVYK